MWCKSSSSRKSYSSPIERSYPPTLASVKRFQQMRLPHSKQRPPKQILQNKNLPSNNDLHLENTTNLDQIPTSPELQLPTQENVQEVNTTKPRDKEAVLQAHKPQEAEVDPLHNGQPNLQRNIPVTDNSLKADRLEGTNLGNQAEHLVEGQHSPVEILVIPLSTRTLRGIHLSQTPPRDTK